MGREVRRVPADWQHPKDKNGNFEPLLDGYADRVAEWDREAAEWAAGKFPDYADEESKKLPFAEWDGPRPVKSDYMPDWPVEQKTHIMMYEDTSEGTPISPAFATAEELAPVQAEADALKAGSDDLSASVIANTSAIFLLR